MAQFIETIEQWRRMCDAYSTYDEESYCKGCPIMELEFDEHGCDAIFSDWAKAADWDKVEEVIHVWAERNPEPVYPTWEEWLAANDVLEPDNVRLNGDYRFYYNGEPVYNIPSPKMFEPIPDDIAEKLGLQPKEVNNAEHTTH